MSMSDDHVCGVKRLVDVIVEVLVDHNLGPAHLIYNGDQEVTYICTPHVEITSDSDVRGKVTVAVARRLKLQWGEQFFLDWRYSARTYLIPELPWGGERDFVYLGVTDDMNNRFTV